MAGGNGPNQLGDTGSSNFTSMDQIGNEMRALSMELATQKLKMKKKTEPAKAANQAASGGV